MRILGEHKHLVPNSWIDDDAGSAEEVKHFYRGGKLGFEKQNI